MYVYCAFWFVCVIDRWESGIGREIHTCNTQCWNCLCRVTEHYIRLSLLSVNDTVNVSWLRLHLFFVQKNMSCVLKMLGQAPSLCCVVYACGVNCLVHRGVNPITAEKKSTQSNCKRRRSTWAVQSRELMKVYASCRRCLDGWGWIDQDPGTPCAITGGKGVNSTGGCTQGVNVKNPC